MTEAVLQPGPSRPARKGNGRVSPVDCCKRGLLALGMALLASTAWAQLTPSLDVPYVPTPQNVVDRMLQMAGVKSTDYVMDVGCGDGRMVVSAAKDYGARGFCNDLDPVRVNEAKRNAQRAGVMDRIEFRQGDLFTVDISQADVLVMYLLESINLKLRPKILADAKPGTRVVSHAFSMGDWKPDMTESMDGRTLYLWVVPARLDGRWNVRQGEGKGSFDLTIKQAYQQFTGQAMVKGKPVPVRDGQIRGKEISFSVEEKPGQVRNFRGRVNGRTIEVSGGNNQAWLANRQ